MLDIHLLRLKKHEYVKFKGEISFEIFPDFGVPWKKVKKKKWTELKLWLTLYDLTKSYKLE